MRPAREPVIEPVRSRHPWPFPVSGKHFGLPKPPSGPQAGAAGPGAAGSSFVT